MGRRWGAYPGGACAVLLNAWLRGTVVWYVRFIKSMEEYVVPKWQGQRHSVSCLSVSVIDFMTIAKMIIMSAHIYSR